MLRGLKQNLVLTRGPHRVWARPASVWVSSVELWISSGLLKGQGLWVQQTWVWHKPSWRRLPLTPQYSCQNLHRTEETDSWRVQTKPCTHQDPGERSSDPISDWPRLPCKCPGVSGRGVSWWWPAAGSGSLIFFFIGDSSMTLLYGCFVILFFFFCFLFLKF